MSTLLASELLKLFSCKISFHVQHCLFQPLIIVFQEMRYLPLRLFLNALLNASSNHVTIYCCCSAAADDDW